MPLFTLCLICWGIFLQTSAPVHGSNENMLADYTVRQWRGEDGLGEDIVNGVEQSLDGFVWCVTQNEVLRFDGKQFLAVDRTGLPADSLGWRGILADRQGMLWAYGGRGLFRYDGRSWVAVLEKDSPKINALEEDTKGVIWAASEQSIYRIEAGRVDNIHTAYNGAPLSVSEMDIAPDGQVFIVGRQGKLYGLYRLQERNFISIDLPPEYAGEEPLKVYVGPSGTLWLVTAAHLLCRIDGTWIPVPLPSGQPDWSGVRTILERQGGELWVGTIRGLFRWRGEQWSELTTRDGFFPFAVRSMKEDREGALWIAGTGGLMRMTPKALQVFLSGLGWDKEPYISLLLSGSEWWAGIAGLKPLIGAPGRFKPARIDGYPENTTASALLKARDGSLWIGTHSRNLWHWKNGKAEMVLPKPGTEIPLNAVTALHEDRAGKIWVGTLSGLSSVTREGLEPIKVGNSYPKDTVNTIYEDDDGTLWVGFQTLGLLKLVRNGNPTWFQRGEGLPDNSVRTVYRDKAGVLWVGTSGGLVRWVKNRQSVFTTAQGLIDDAIRQIVEDDLGYLWLGSRYGLMRVNQTEFSDVEGGAKTALSLRYFGHKDGMKSEECTSARPVKTPDGKLWFPTTDGLVMADPKALPKTTETPLIYLEEVSVANRLLWSSRKLHPSPDKSRPVTLILPTRPRDVEFRFTTPECFAPDRIRFRYRIEGLDEEWSKPDASRVALLRSIPPGNYRFRVESCSRDGVWSAEESSVAFRVPPRFWQTVWFRAGAGTIAVSGLVLLFALQERKKAHRKVRELEHEQMLDRERARIARDIHDEVGAGLTEVALLSELAQGDMHGPGNKYLDDIFKTARDLTRSLDEIVWSINPANDTLEKLISYLVEFARDFLGTASLPCRLQVPTVVPSITVASPLRHQICLTVKETLNNIVKHAGATEVRMEISWEAEGVLHISIKDNGRGFERAVVADPAAIHDGLNNISSRMREIGGECHQQSDLGKGTCTALSVKIPTAEKALEAQ